MNTMNRNKSFFLTLSKPIFVLAILGALFLTGCQKAASYEVEATAEPVDFRSSLLQMVYSISGEQLNDPEIEQLYSRMMDNLTEDQSAQLETLVQQYAAQAQTDITNSPISTRSVESSLSAGTPGDGFGQSVAKAGNTLFVGAPGSEKVYLYTEDGSGNYSLRQTIPGRGGFGSRVAASGEWLAVVAPSYGQVYLYKNQVSYWSLRGILTPGESLTGTGTGIAMDGGTLAVMGRSASAQSQIFVYQLNGSQWSQEAVLSAPDVFLWDLDIQGNTIVGNGGTNAGSGVIFSPNLYIYNRSGSSWGPANEVALPFGYQLSRAVAISGSTIVANTFFYLFQTSGRNAVFSAASGSWAFNTEFVQPGVLPFAQTRWLDIQDSQAIVTVPTGGFFPDPNDVAHIFTQSGGSWNLTETLTPSTGGGDYLFGESVILDGGKAILGAPGSPAAGRVFIYQ